jgi:TusA-related sulfurtransferase
MRIYLPVEENGGGIQVIIGCYATKELAQEAIQNHMKKNPYLQTGDHSIELFDLDLMEVKKALKKLEIGENND